jgi:hypothetical protein
MMLSADIWDAALTTFPHHHVTMNSWNAKTMPRAVFSPEAQQYMAMFVDRQVLETGINLN